MCYTISLLLYKSWGIVITYSVASPFYTKIHKWTELEGSNQNETARQKSDPLECDTLLITLERRVGAELEGVQMER